MSITVTGVGCTKDKKLDPDQAAKIVAANWTSRKHNQPSFWVAYLLGAFQEGQNEDGDGEPVRGFGWTPAKGGSLIYIETCNDVADIGGNALVFKQETVVHEVGHAVANSGKHPVTGFNAVFSNPPVPINDTSPDGILVTHHDSNSYLPAYLDWIRRAKAPQS